MYILISTRKSRKYPQMIIKVLPKSKMPLAVIKRGKSIQSRNNKTSILKKNLERQKLIQIT